MKKLVYLLLLLAMVMSMVACSSSSTETSASPSGSPSESATPEVSDDTSEDESVFPFTLVTKDDAEVTFTHVPETILSCNANAGDQLMALGLGDKIIGTAYNNSLINPEFREEYEAIPVVGDTCLSIETVLDLEPEFVYGRSSAFNDNYNTTHDNMTMNGIMSLSSIEGYKVGADVEDVYQDFYNLGRIFQIEDKAEEVVNGIKSQVSTVEEAVADLDIVKVFVYDVAREEGAYTCGNNFTSQLISHAGGENIFSDLDTTWATVSWEEIIDRAPEVIIINDYGSTSLEDKYAELLENPALAEIPAIANNRIISVTLCEVFASSMTGTTIEKIALACHPEAF